MALFRVTSVTGDSPVRYLRNGVYTITVEHPDFHISMLSDVVVQALLAHTLDG